MLRLRKAAIAGLLIMSVLMSACDDTNVQREIGHVERRVNNAAYTGCVTINENVSGMGNNDSGCANMHK